MGTRVVRKVGRITQVTNTRGEKLRSGFEDKLTQELQKKKVDYEYEAVRIPFTPPAKVRHYTPDIILPNGIIIEIKGRFVSADRQKHKHIQAQYPDLDIRFVFQRATQKITKVSKTTYGMWCKSQGIKYAEGVIPKAWIDAPVNEVNKTYIKGWKENGKKK
jgi:hypothetical protein